MIKITKSFIQFVFKGFFVFLGKNFSGMFLEELMKALQKTTKKYTTYHQRPINTNSVETLSQFSTDLPQLAIVIQGPLKIENEFTFETIKLYKKHFPKAIIILSTWNDESNKVLYKIESLGITILLNDKPDYPGISHINYQIASSKEGIKKAKELGAEYAIKTRTDQRMYATNIASFLFNIIKTFPLNKSIKKQNKRIVGLSLNTFKYRMYGLSDMFTYGHIDDMLMFWNIPFDNRVFNEKDKEKARLSLRNFAEMRACEVFLTTEFLKNIGRKQNWTLEDSWKVMADHFCIIDKETLDLFWGKYDLLEYQRKNYNKKINVFEEIDFKKWFNMYCNHNDYIFPEEILDNPLNS